MDEKRPKLIQLRPAIEPDEDIVAMREKLLAMAKQGKLDGLAWVGVDASGGTVQSWAGSTQITTLVGAAHELATTLTLSSLSNFGE